MVPPRTRFALWATATTVIRPRAMRPRRSRSANAAAARPRRMVLGNQLVGTRGAWRTTGGAVSQWPSPAAAQQAHALTDARARALIIYRRRRRERWAQRARPGHAAVCAARHEQATRGARGDHRGHRGHSAFFPDPPLGAPARARACERARGLRLPALGRGHTPRRLPGAFRCGGDGGGAAAGCSRPARRRALVEGPVAQGGARATLESCLTHHPRRPRAARRRTAPRRSRVRSPA